ncbi:hypothetical protein [Amycolatopsis tucumanensis]|uniref:hypothetical protein n=1 Tax=Amycolatopsis tucumanensis TaxID=401106 RepID=UPI001F1FBA55|nr:hypothetical protein [Amycolatopsis tucumanensis]MCF6423688.1 hypothetical protein [Amycolatopsis tucumanensis]
MKFKITVINGTSQPVDASSVSIGVEAQFDSTRAEPVYDSNGPCGGGGMSTATILPGRTFSYEAAYAVGAAPGEMQLAFQPYFGGDKAVYLGPA